MLGQQLKGMVAWVSQQNGVSRENKHNSNEQLTVTDPFSSWWPATFRDLHV